jgi:ribosomal protein S27E
MRTANDTLLFVPIALPDATTRWRCAVCGNLTRFDVTRVTRAREFLHVELSGQPRVEESTVLDESVERVVCRWCGNADSVTLEPRPAAGAAGGTQNAGGNGQEPPDPQQGPGSHPGGR